MWTCQRCGQEKKKEKTLFCSVKCSNLNSAEQRKIKLYERYENAINVKDWNFFFGIENCIKFSKEINDCLKNVSIENRKSYFFVYVDFRNDNNKPFYVGKGIVNRVRSFEERNYKQKQIAKRHGHTRYVLFATLIENEAFSEEIRLIEKFDTFKNGANLTLGGDGAQGAIRPVSAKQKACKKIEQLSVDGKQIKVFSSIKEAIKETKIYTIGNSLRGKQKLAGGFVWKYVDSCFQPKSTVAIENMKKSSRRKVAREVIQTDLNGNVIARFICARDAAEKTNVGIDNIRRCCYTSQGKATAGGFLWQFSDTLSI